MRVELKKRKKFKLDLRAYDGLVQTQMVAAMKVIVLDLFRRIVLRTPVDTGVARGSWVIGIRDTGAEPNITGGLSEGAATNISLDRANSVLGSYKDLSRILISSYVKYIKYLEAGHSRRSAEGMVAVSIEEVKVKYGL